MTVKTDYIKSSFDNLSLSKFIENLKNKRLSLDEKNDLLCHYCQLGNCDVVASILDIGADIDANDNTPVLYSIIYGWNNLLMCLLNAGAEIDLEILQRLNIGKIKSNVAMTLMEYFNNSAQEQIFRQRSIEYLVEYEYERKH